MDFRQVMQERYQQAYREHPGLEQFRQRKKGLLWGMMGLFALQKLLLAAALGGGWAMAGALLGLFIPGIFALAVWRGNWKFSLLLLIPALNLALGLVRQALPVLLSGEQYPPFVYLCLLADGALTLYLAGLTAWLVIPEKNRGYAAALNQVTEELIRLSKEQAAGQGRKDREDVERRPEDGGR